MGKYLNGILEYMEYKLPLAVWAAVWADNYAILFILFIALEVLDIFTRWLALSYQCYKALYPETPCSMWRAFCFMWQARKWRYIKSTGLRDGFCDKTLLYLLLLALAGIVDGVLGIAHAPRVLTSVIATVLATTEALSILENMADCNVAIVKTIREEVKKKWNTQKN
jgi:hypothetical protein